MTDIFEHTPLALRREVGARLRARREALGLKRSAVATALGYRTLSQGARRIADREAGIPGPLLDEDKYYGLMEETPGEFRARLFRAEDIEVRIQHLGKDVMAMERRLLQVHAERVLRCAASICRTPALAGVRSPAMGLRVLWMGGGSLSLGALAGAWAAGSLVANTQDHGPVYIFDGAGSALSGAGRCTGVDGAGTLREIRQSPTRFLGGQGPWRSRHPPPLSPLSLADALVALGARVPAVHFHLLAADARPLPELLAVYDPNTGRFRTQAGEARTLAVVPPSDVSVQRTYGGVSVGGSPPRPLQLTPGWHLGAFQEEQLVHRSGLRLAGGRIQADGGRYPVKISGPCPPSGVLPLLAEALAARGAGPPVHAT
ncbi:MAG: hypothetical protein VX265_05205 [Myxococcota bacterium]|nr:hypothetical protein [Myxococcota bacterium]